MRYRIAAPGAPESGLLIDMNNIPNPSPNHHTSSDQANDAASASLTVRRFSRPTPIQICSNANSVLSGPDGTA